MTNNIIHLVPDGDSDFKEMAVQFIQESDSREFLVYDAENGTLKVSGDFNRARLLYELEILTHSVKTIWLEEECEGR